MKIIVRIKQFYSFAKVRIKYGKFDVNADKKLPLHLFKEKYQALKQQDPDWIKWALGGQTLAGFHDTIEYFFFLIIEFPSIFSADKSKLNNKTPIKLACEQNKFTPDSLVEITDMLLNKPFINGEAIALKYRNNLIDLPDDDFLSLVDQSLKFCHYKLFIFLQYVSKVKSQYVGSIFDSLFISRITQYIDNELSQNSAQPWFAYSSSSILQTVTFQDSDLYTAVEFHQNDGVILLIDTDKLNILLEYTDHNGRNAFDIAVLNNFNIRDAIYEKIDDKTLFVNKALLHAARSNNIQAMTYLLAKNHKIDMKLFTNDKGDRRVGITTGCFDMIQAGYEEMLSKENAAKCAANINTLDDKGDSPLHAAVKQNNTFAVRALIASNANVFLENKDKLTPLDLALKLGYQEVFNLLMSKVDTSAKYARDKWSCTIAWEKLVLFLNNYMVTTSNKNPNTVKFFINYFIQPFSNLFAQQQTRNYYYQFLCGKISLTEDIEKQDDFRSMSLAEKLIAIADRCKQDKSYVNRMRSVDPLLYDLMITNSFYTCCCTIEGEDEINRENFNFVTDRLKDEDFCERFALILERLRTNIPANQKYAL
ncbi:MAG: ankyrin repeat domain-containing protein, partial [Gammaproteobacteria bacterium]